VISSQHIDVAQIVGAVDITATGAISEEVEATSSFWTIAFHRLISV